MRVSILGALFVCLVVSPAGAEDPEAKAPQLIEKLVVVAGKTKRTPKECYDAAAQLQDLGIGALPHLIKGLEDDRPSVPFLRVRDQTVGVACLSIIMDMIYALPDSYPGSFYRFAADGKRHERPVFFKQIWGRVGENEKLVQWLRDREGKALEDIQVEALTWVLSCETEIGATDDEERVRYIEPLQKRLQELKQQAEQKVRWSP